MHDRVSRKYWKLVYISRLRTCQIIVSKFYLAVFHASPGTKRQEIAVRTLRSTGSNTIQTSDRIEMNVTYYFSIRSPIAIIFISFGSKKCRRCFLGMGPLGKQEAPPDSRSWGELRRIPRRESVQIKVGTLRTPC